MAQQAKKEKNARNKGYRIHSLRKNKHFWGKYLKKKINVDLNT